MKTPNLKIYQKKLNLKMTKTKTSNGTMRRPDLFKTASALED